ncbi:MAG: prolipoprotein diacylglyceryl transferase [Candidatus Moranbacteria bacterium]|nr:prolipoprotein diacylglyceryl transferase [Candidatus Moranbacteria bacterium]
MIEWYQHIPERIDPVVFTVGFFSLYWYAIAYMAAVGVSGFFVWREVRGYLSFDRYIDLLFNIVAGMLIGSRLGYVLLYNFSFYAAHPLAIVWPFDTATGAWIGIAGMSYYGGFVGVLIGVWLFVRQYGVAFWKVADAIAWCVPMGYFFGRIGNFLNGELYGRVTHRAWGMYFPGADMGNVVLRHPSPLYEAFFEGIVLFGVLLFVRKRYRFSGAVAVAYVIGYSFLRWWVEFFREPDPQIGLLFGWMSLGQLIALFVCVIGALLWTLRTNEKV